MDIDGVFSGGGIKGFALVGAYAAVEQRGFRFKRVAGTSAGSIVAGLIAAGYTSKEVCDLIDEIDLSTFLDARRILLPSPLTKWLLLYWKMGLYKGNALENWLEEKLAAKGLRTFADLPPQTLRVIASDLTNGKLLVLPDDIAQYGIRPESLSIAKAIRMSCSLPYFFEPVRLKTPDGVSIIVDGGVLSNFPMWLFDRENVKKVRPVLGVTLSHDTNHQPKNEVFNAIDMFGALFETMKDAHDSRYISRKHARNIIFIPTEGLQATEFSLKEEKKNQLIDFGKERALKFFQSWSC